jgi:hypothetical protein
VDAGECFMLADYFQQHQYIIWPTAVGTAYFAEFDE